MLREIHFSVFDWIHETLVLRTFVCIQYIQLNLRQFTIHIILHVLYHCLNTTQRVLDVCTCPLVTKQPCIP